MASTPFKTVYRVVSWLSLAGFLLIAALILRKSAPPRVAVDPAAAARVAQKFAAADEAKAAGQSAQAVTLDRTELNSYLAKNLQVEGSAPAAPQPPPASAPASPEPSSGAQSSDPGPSLPDSATLEEVQSSVKDVKVDMDGDLVKAYVVFDFHGKDLSLELDGHLGSQDGYLRFEPVAGKLGSMPLPQSILQATVDKMMASPENREKLRLPDDVSGVQIVNGQAVVSYK
ncbi:MAG TPA: hypothetical protein VEJ46_15830 [Candidatus Acidoferrum sp.]|nr:hypothetical protein [Candidatus Acidoferrum sp.]